jgi:hypothetical protein
MVAGSDLALPAAHPFQQQPFQQQPFQQQPCLQQPLHMLRFLQTDFDVMSELKAEFMLCPIGGQIARDSDRQLRLENELSENPAEWRLLKLSTRWPAGGTPAAIRGIVWSAQFGSSNKYMLTAALGGSCVGLVGRSVVGCPWLGMAGGAIVGGLVGRGLGCYNYYHQMQHPYQSFLYDLEQCDLRECAA